MREFVEFGKIIKPHGVRGNFVVRSNFANPERYLEHCYIIQMETYQPFVLEASGALSNGDLIVNSNLILDIASVQLHIGKQLYINKELLPKIENGYYVFDVIGLAVCLENGQKIGIVTDIVDFGSGPMIEVNTGKQKEKLEYYLYNEHTVKNVDLKSKKMIIILPDYV